MNGVELAIIILSIALILFFIIFSRWIIETSFGYGTWETKYTPCENEDMKCDQPSFQFTNKYCVPNPKTRRGCINSNGKQVYNTEITSVPCQMQCQKTKWKIDIGICEPTTGFQEVIYTCLEHDSTGMNGCTLGGLVPLRNGQYQDVTSYNAGDVVSWDIKCIPDVTQYFMLNKSCSAKELLVEGNLENGEPCRYWDENGTIIALETETGHLRMEIGETRLKAGIESNITLLLAPVKENTIEDGILSRIGMVHKNRHWGWLKTDGGYATWERAKSTPQDKGINSGSAQLFVIRFFGEDKIEILTENREKIFLDSYQELKGRYVDLQ